MLVGPATWLGTPAGLERPLGATYSKRGVRLTTRSGHSLVVGCSEELLMARRGQLDAVPAGDVTRRDHAVLRFGGRWPESDPRPPRFEPTAAYGSQKRIAIPSVMTSELAFFLGAYVAEGHTTPSNWTVTITNAVDEVLGRVVDAVRTTFGTEPRVVRPPDRCPSVAVSSKTLVEFLKELGCGRVAAQKRIPDWIMRSSRETIVAFLEGLFLDAFTAWMGSTPKWGIGVVSPGLLDDVQVLLTRLGIVHGRCEKIDAHGRASGEVYAVGEAAQGLLGLVPFAEPDKARRAHQRLAATPGQSTSDVVPIVRPRELHAVLPRSRTGHGPRSRYAFLRDPRTRHVSRRTIERLRAEPGVTLPSDLVWVLENGIHFAPVAEVTSLGDVGLLECGALIPDTLNGFIPWESSDSTSHGAAG